VQVSNAYGTTNSVEVTLKVNSSSGTPPHIILQPLNATVTVGNTATFRVLAAGTQPLSYQWMFAGTNFVNIAGGTNIMLTLTNVQPNQAGTYMVQVSNAYGTTNSVEVTLTVNASSPVAPFIITQPTNQTVMAGGVASFRVAAGGTAPLSYGWLWTSAGTNSSIVGTNATLILTNVQSGQAGTYMAQVSNAYGTTNSVEVTLTVNSPSFLKVTTHIQSMVAHPDGLLTLNLIGDSSTPYVLYCTTNLTPPVVWKPIYTNYSGGSWQFVDTNNCGTGAKYYKVAPPLP